MTKVEVGPTTPLTEQPPQTDFRQPGYDGASDDIKPGVPLAEIVQQRRADQLAAVGKGSGYSTG